MARPLTTADESAHSLEGFARRIEELLRREYKTSMASLLCRSVNVPVIAKLEHIVEQGNSELGSSFLLSGIKRECLRTGIKQAFGDVDKPLTKRGRKPEDWSRTTDIYMGLIAWKHAPQTGKMSLRALAAKIGVSHQLLSYYHKQLSSWRLRGGSPYDRVAIHLKHEAERETDPLRRLELERQARFWQQQANWLMVKSVADSFRDALREKVEAGRSLSQKEIQVAKMYERRGFQVLPVLHPK